MPRKRKKARYVVNKRKTKVQIKEKKERTIEEKFYWLRVIIAVISAFFGVFIFKLIGWWLFLYLIGFMLVWPFIQSFLIFRLPYKKGKWDWKKILKTGVGAHFFIFMLITTVIFTLMTYQSWDDRLFNPADTNDLIIENNIAYVADGSNGLLILDVTSNSNNRELLNSWKYDNINSEKIYKNNDYLFVGDKNGNLSIIDISNTSNPQNIANILTKNRIRDIYSSENILYIANDKDGLNIYDINNIVQPAYLTKIDGNIQGIEIEDKIAYLAKRNGEIQIWNISTPSLPTEISRLELSGNIYSVKIRETTAFLSAGDQGLHIVNISDLENLNLISTFNTTNNATDVIIKDSKAYIAGGEGGIAFVNISDINNPINITNTPYNTIGDAINIEINGDYLYIADGKRGISLINLLDPSPAPEEIVKGANKTISFGWIWLITSGFAILIILKNIQIKKKSEF